MQTGRPRELARATSRVSAHLMDEAAHIPGAARVLPCRRPDGRARTFIGSLLRGVGAKEGEGGVLLSGGERQRLSIARAMPMVAPILLPDEASLAASGPCRAVLHDRLATVPFDEPRRLVDGTPGHVETGVNPTGMPRAR